MKTIETEKLSKKVGKKSKPKNIKRRKQYIILELEEEAQSWVETWWEPDMELRNEEEEEEEEENGQNA